MMHRNRFRFAPRPHHVGLAILLLAAGLILPMCSRADSPWDVTIYAETGSPGGWVQVRENEIEGTRLHIDNDLDVNEMTTLRARATRWFSDDDQLRFGVAASMLDGSATLAEPVVFNGTTVAPGKLDTVTHFQDFLEADIAYWHRLAAFDNGGGFWGSIGAAYVLLNFRLDGTIAADSAGHELKEDFYVQELPVPVIGLHLDYPFAETWKLDVDATAGRLPWVDSHHSEGGEVRLAQTDEDLSAGVDYRFASDWHAGAYVFYSFFAQNERSHEDGNAIRLSSRGVGVDVGYRF